MILIGQSVPGEVVCLFFLLLIKSSFTLLTILTILVPITTLVSSPFGRSSSFGRKPIIFEEPSSLLVSLWLTHLLIFSLSCPYLNLKDRLVWRKPSRITTLFYIISFLILVFRKSHRLRPLHLSLTVFFDLFFHPRSETCRGLGQSSTNTVVLSFSNRSKFVSTP